MNTIGFQLRRGPWALLLLCVALASCGKGRPPLTAELTFKADGTRFSGTVVSRDASSITLTGPAGDTHTFLYTELADIKYGTAGDATAASGSAGSSTAIAGNPGSAVISGKAPTPGQTFQLPAGTVLHIANNGIIDSSIVPIGGFALGTVEGDLKAGDGKVLIPSGANVTLTIRDEKMVAGRLQMELEIGSLDFSNHHFLLSAAKGAEEPGAVAMAEGPEPGSATSRVYGKNVHLEDHSLLVFKTGTPTVVRAAE